MRRGSDLRPVAPQGDRDDARELDLAPAALRFRGLVPDPALPLDLGALDPENVVRQIDVPPPQRKHLGDPQPRSEQHVDELERQHGASERERILQAARDQREKILAAARLAAEETLVQARREVAAALTAERRIVAIEAANVGGDIASKILGRKIG